MVSLWNFALNHVIHKCGNNGTLGVKAPWPQSQVRIIRLTVANHSYVQHVWKSLQASSGFTSSSAK